MAYIRNLKQFVQAQEAKLATKYRGSEPVELQNPEDLSSVVESDKAFKPLPGQRFLDDNTMETTFIVTPNS